MFGAILLKAVLGKVEKVAPANWKDLDATVGFRVAVELSIQSTQVRRLCVYCFEGFAKRVDIVYKVDAVQT